MDWANQEVSAARLKQDSSVALFLLVFGAGKYFLKVGGHGRDPHSVSPWNCWRTWELHSVPRTCFNASFSHCLSFSPTPVIACHSPPLSVGVLLSDSILDATAAFPTICCTLPSHCSHQILVIDSRVEYQQSSSQNGTKMRLWITYYYYQLLNSFQSS